MSLTSSKAAERGATLELTRASIAAHAEAATRALQEQILEVARRRAAEDAEAIAAAEATRRALAEKLVADFREEVSPLVASWLREPGRQVAMRLADAHRRANERALEELGTGLWYGQVVLAFVEQITSSSPGLLAAFVEANWGSTAIVDAASRFQRSTTPSDIFEALEALEAAIATHAAARASLAAHGPSDYAERIFAARRGAATDRDATLARERVNEETERARLAALSDAPVSGVRTDTTRWGARLPW